MPIADPRSSLTDRQVQVLAAIRRLTEQTGYPPTLREIGGAVGLASASSVLHHVRALEDAGLLTRSAGRPRARVVTAPMPRRHQSTKS